MERTIKITRRIKNQDNFYDHFGIIDGNLKTTRSEIEAYVKKQILMTLKKIKQDEKDKELDK